MPRQARKTSGPNNEHQLRDYSKSSNRSENRPLIYDVGSLVSDAGRKIAKIDYDLNNNPVRIQFTNGNVTRYVYSATGEKLRVIYQTAVPNITVAIGSSRELARSEIQYADSTDYLLGGCLTLKNGRIDKYQFDEGYCQAEKNTSNTSQDNFTFYYYDRDHLGNIRQVTKATRAKNGSVVQQMTYYPFGALFCNGSTVDGVQSRKYNGKEFDTMHGLNTYDYGARQYNPVTARWDRVDPLAEKTPWVTPYMYCEGDPVNKFDPDGKQTSPIYNREGEFMGTDDEGLQGIPMVMDNKDFKPGMSHEDALSKDCDISSFSSDEAFESFASHYNQLPNRPDYDGYLTLEEANNWYREGNGQPLFTDIKKLDLSRIRSLGDKYVGQVKTFNLLISSNSLDDGLVYGNITLKRYPNNSVRAYADKYDFDMKSWKNPLNWIRNGETIIGEHVAGKGQPFEINIYGSQKLKPMYP